MSFVGFSEEDLQRIKSSETGSVSGSPINTPSIKKLSKIGGNQKKLTRPYKLPIIQKQNSEEALDGIDFKQCKLSLQSPTSPPSDFLGSFPETEIKDEINDDNNTMNEISNDQGLENNNIVEPENKSIIDELDNVRKLSKDSTPDIVRGVSDYNADELVNHKQKLEDLQLKQRIMEEQNKKRKEMLAKALADRTKQTEEEVLRLEKIKKELQVLDGQFSVDVAVLRKKIDQACLSYADAEKHYLKVEKEFLQAKISLQKEKEKKELLTEHLCALITHNETRKADKLQTLMLELATDKKMELKRSDSFDDVEPNIVDGVDLNTGKIMELPTEC